jgi:hypothetical protein
LTPYFEGLDMLENLIANPAFLLTILTLSLVSALTMVTAVFQFEQQRGRLDPATRLHDVREQLAIKRDELARKETEISEANRKLELRDRVVAETAALEERLVALRLELDGLADARHQIEETKQSAANSATELAILQDKLAAARSEAAAATEDLNARKSEYAALGAEIERIRRETTATGLALPREIEALQAKIAELNAEREGLERDLQVRRGELGLLAAARNEVAQLATQREALAREAQEALSSAASARTQKVEAQTDLSCIARELDAANGSLAAAKSELKKSQASLREIEDQVASLATRKEILEREIENRRVEVVGGTAALEEDPIADLVQLPVLLQGAIPAPRGPQTEVEALHEVRVYLREHKLTYDPRTVAAFHTALKINDTSQLTVLAGVSGTGKSLLPRRYAEAMGIGFLPISVEPRWDSPQDLLGFYNYIEKRYRATDLARAMVHLDPYKTSGLSDGGFVDRMVLVLLDEMNLARVEYYFSEFLSRLEIRPPYAAVDPAEVDDRRRRDSWISIDIRGSKNGSIKLFPPHNMLFVGTMNDDESTQSLSDKVLDRSNIMQFTAPQEFRRQQQVDEPAVVVRHRSFRQWRTWVKSTSSLQGAAEDKAHRVIRELASIMEDCGRPFGHRLNASMLAYAANYPDHGHLNDGLDLALVDQIEFRILPKLRGLRIEEHDKTFQRLEALAANELTDHKFADRLKMVVDNQRAAGGLFNWRGLARDTDGN